MGLLIAAAVVGSGYVAIYNRRTRSTEPLSSEQEDVLAAAARPHWNPYAPEQSRARRVQDARRRRVRTREIPDEIDYYTLFGLARDATPQEIEAAYRRVVALIHPDRYQRDPIRRGKAEEKMRQANAAIQILRDPEERARYDARRGAGP